jgi:hypothetical protein
MRKPIAAVAVAVLALLVAAPPALAQKATEVYIPIGKSPGLSGRYTVIGRITAIKSAGAAHTMTVSGPSRTWTGTVDDQTRVYIDRSLLRRRNQYGTTNDCRVGATVEMKYKGRPGEEGAVVEWIKIRADEAPPRPR